jgi:penicillin-binding protein 2
LFWKRDLPREKENFEKRISLIGVVMVICLAILLIRIAWLQLAEGERYFLLSKNSRLRLLPLSPTRGLILDSKGEKLAGNEAGFSLAVVPSNVAELDQLINGLSKMIQLDRDAVKKKLLSAPNPFRPVSLKKNLDISLVTFILEREEDFPGVVIVTDPIRVYPYVETGSHLLGYLGEVSQKELSLPSSFGIELGDLVGKMGIEKVYNSYLQGEKGGRQIEVDAHGRPLRTISEVDPLSGYNIYLTMDLEVQKIAEEELGKRKGAVVIGDPHTGEILALVSHPSFNPNLFSHGLSRQRWEELKSNPQDPLENRAVRGEYPPASTFKIMVAMAALETQHIGVKDTFFCPGEYRVGNRTFKCWKEYGHGRINLEEAIIHSCDVYFYQLGLKMGVEKIAHFSSLFELGEPTGIDLLWEAQGLVPNPSWKRKNRGDSWYHGDTANLSIGQGYILTTPLQMFRVISAVANGGYLIQPYLVKRIVDINGKVVQENSHPPKKKIGLSISNLRFLQRSLAGVVREGTGWRARNNTVSISGKTGTAQSSDEERPHNWFLSYAPSHKPRLAAVVLVENREEDISIAAQISGRIFSRIFGEMVASAP